MRAVIVTAGPYTAASANNIAASQSVTSPASVVINGALATGGVATLDNFRNILITSAGNDSGITFAITGTNWQGNVITETLTGANAGAATSKQSYSTITAIKPSGSTAAAITVGTTTTAESPWVRLSEYEVPQTALQCNVAGTINYTVQSTLDDPNDPTNPVAVSSMTWINSGDATVVNATTSLQSSFAYPPRWVRLKINSFTAGAGNTVSMTIYQARRP